MLEFNKLCVIIIFPSLIFTSWWSLKKCNQYHTQTASATHNATGTSLSFSRLKLAYIELSENSNSRLDRRFYLLNFTYRILQRDYQKNLFSKPILKLATASKKIPFWTYWDTGFDRAPLIVKKCNARLQTILPFDKYELYRLDDKSLNEYVDLPQQVVNNRKNMAKANYADLIRIELLTAYGGVWSDSTVYITSPIPNEVTEANFFAFKRSKEPVLLSSWFYSVKQPNNILLLWVRHITHEYWKTHSSQGYNDHHMIFESLRALLPIAKSTFEMSPWYSARLAHSLQSIMNRPFNRTTFEMEKSKSFAQKLTYKKKCTFLSEL